MATVNKNQQLIFDGQWLPSKSFNRRNLFRSTFKNCFLEDSRFKSATLSGSVFINCDMKNVKFNKADLIRATFIECDLRNADFRKASVREINLIDCYMNDVLGLDDLPMRCPETGEFTAWKKCYVNEGDEYRSVLVKLFIPSSAKRSSSGGRKCRANKAKVLSITDILDASVTYDHCFSDFDPSFTYKVGQYVEPDEFDEDRWNERSTGIHFFVNKQEALDY